MPPTLTKNEWSLTCCQSISDFWGFNGIKLAAQQCWCSRNDGSQLISHFQQGISVNFCVCKQCYFINFLVLLTEATGPNLQNQFPNCSIRIYNWINFQLHFSVVFRSSTLYSRCVSTFWELAIPWIQLAGCFLAAATRTLVVPHFLNMYSFFSACFIVATKLPFCQTLQFLLWCPSWSWLRLRSTIM